MIGEVSNSCMLLSSERFASDNFCNFGSSTPILHNLNRPHYNPLNSKDQKFLDRIEQEQEMESMMNRYPD